MKQLLQSPNGKQFLSYFFVGGISAVIEWTVFTIAANMIGMHYIGATCLAFVLATIANWLLGRFLTFKDNKSYIGKRAKEMSLIFLVSAVGLLFNMGLMFVFVSLLALDSPFGKTLSKIMATGIVFLWNFLIRKHVVYR